MKLWLASTAGALLGLGSAAALAQASPPDSGLQVDTDAATKACVTPAQAQRPPSSLTQAERQRFVACIDAVAARQLNAQLPRQIDDVTRLDRITTDGPVLTYHYTVLRRVADLPPNVIPAIEQSTRTHVCAQANMVSTMAMGGSYGYRWVDPDGREIHRITISSC